MRLSVVILTCNQERLTLRCLDSLGPLTGRIPDSRVVLIDNGSTDETADIVSGSIPARIGKLRFISLPANIGVAPGRNCGLNVCLDSDYVLILDNDTIVGPGAIEDMMRYMDDNPDVGLAGPRLVSPTGQIQASFKAFPGVREKLRNLAGRSPYLETVPDAPLEPFYVIGACQLVRGSVLRQVGMLDADIFFGPEDADFCMRVRDAGHRVIYLPHIQIIHDWQRTSSRSPLSATSRRHIRGLLHFYRKWKRWW